jgi:hypothetical protein
MGHRANHCFSNHIPWLSESLIIQPVSDGQMTYLKLASILQLLRQHDCRRWHWYSEQEAK